MREREEQEKHERFLLEQEMRALEELEKEEARIRRQEELEERREMEELEKLKRAISEKEREKQAIEERRRKEEAGPVADQSIKPREPVLTLEQLKKKPAGIDILALEWYLTNVDFERVFKMNRPKFYQLPKWKRDQLKKNVGLF